MNESHWILDREHIENLMDEALVQAEHAAKSEEVPVGAVIEKDGEIIARAHNLVESDHTVCSHAEILAINAASKVLGDWRLTDCNLYVTLEPCCMCIGSIKLARLSTLIFGAHDPQMGSCGSLFDLSGDARLGATPRVISGIREEQCRKLMQGFFKSHR